MTTPKSPCRKLDPEKKYWKIDKGEELLCNYLSYSDSDDFHTGNILNNQKGRVGIVGNIDKPETGRKELKRQKSMKGNCHE